MIFRAGWVFTDGSGVTPTSDASRYRYGYRFGWVTSSLLLPLLGRFLLPVTLLAKTAAFPGLLRLLCLTR